MHIYGRLSIVATLCIYLIRLIPLKKKSSDRERTHYILYVIRNKRKYKIRVYL